MSAEPEPPGSPHPSSEDALRAEVQTLEAQVAEARAEAERLRTRVARLEAEKASLLRSSAHRDYERPPHYE